MNNEMQLSAKSSSNSRQETNLDVGIPMYKPTWQNKKPGEVPLSTFDKINGLTVNENSDEDDHEVFESVKVVEKRFIQKRHSFSCNPSNQRKHSLPWILPKKQSVDDLNVTSFDSTIQSSTKRFISRCSSISEYTMNDNFKSIIREKCTNVAVLQSCVTYKVILLGDSGVGKTCILVKFHEGKFLTQHFVTTVGLDFMNKIVTVDGQKVKLQIWDTAGQERFRSVTHAYYRDSAALLLLYDVTNKNTFDNIRAWLSEIREYAKDDVVIILIGNKADCSNSERQVKKEDGERLARENNVPFMETSAKTGQNVELSFLAVARQLKSRGCTEADGRFNVEEFVRDNTKAQSICAQCKNM